MTCNRDRGFRRNDSSFEQRDVLVRAAATLEAISGYLRNELNLREISREGVGYERFNESLGGRYDYYEVFGADLEVVTSSGDSELPPPYTRFTHVINVSSTRDNVVECLASIVAATMRSHDAVTEVEVVHSAWLDLPPPS